MFKAHITAVCNCRVLFRNCKSTAFLRHLQIMSIKNAKNNISLCNF